MLDSLARIERIERKLDKWLPPTPKPKIVNAISFREYIESVNPRYKWSEMSDRLVSVLQDVADGNIKRLMVFMPPRHGKSELISRLFSAYYLYRYPCLWVGLTSYAADLAYTFSRSSRSNFRDSGGEISEESSAVKHWETSGKGGLWAAGVGGPITGKGFSLGIIDDPLKNNEEANSSAIREKQKDWYNSTFYTRAEEDAAIIIVQTRWHQDDLSGWLLTKEEESPEHWHIVSLEAIKTDEQPNFPKTCTVEKDWRSTGEPLNTVRLSLDRLRAIAKQIGSYLWGALYQQRPRPMEGGIIKTKWVQRYRSLPKFDYVVQSWDTASKAKKINCPWSCTTWGIKGHSYYLLDVHTHRYDYPSGKRVVRNMAAKFNPVYVLIEDKSTGQSLLQELPLEKEWRWTLVSIEPVGDKITRASIESASFEGGRVYLPESALWLMDYEDMLYSYPNVTFMDPMDSTSQFLGWVRRRVEVLPSAVSSGRRASAVAIEGY